MSITFIPEGNMTETGVILSERYELKEKIGAGGMADVYKAVDMRLNRPVAIKILKSEYSDDKNFITRFKNEAKSAAGLSHPNIVSVYDVGDNNGLHYIVMELVEGITLKKFIEKKGRLEVREAVGISIQIAQGMEAAHEHGIIHRDIKPQNIMISRDGKVKVADFGIAKAVSSETYTQNAAGSVHYLSPEQARGGYYDERSDIYSLGVTIYEMLTGELPFGGDSDVSVALKHIRTEAKPAKELVPSVPYSLDKVVQKCMQKHPENRYSSASELITDLKRSITNPDGDFVRINSLSEGRTRTFTSAETEEINSRAAEIPYQTQPHNEPRHEQRNQSNSRKIVHEDYEELDTIESRYERVIIIITIFVAILLVIGAVFVFFKLFGGWPTQGNTNTTPTPGVVSEVTYTPTPAPLNLKMPNVMARTKEDAENFLKTKYPGFIVRFEEDYSIDVAEGYVMEQYPQPDGDVLENQEVTITISLGGQPRQIPNSIIGIPWAQAQVILEANKFKVIPYPEKSDAVQIGQVTRTMPQVGQTVPEGYEIILYYCEGSTGGKTTVPDVRLKSLAVATERLKDMNLHVGEDVTYEYSSNIPYGFVISQSVNPNEVVDENTIVDLIVSMGPAPEEQNPDQETKRSYYRAILDTRNVPNRCTPGQISVLNFEIYQEGMEQAYVVYMTYTDTALEAQQIMVDFDTFPAIYEFKFYVDFANEYVDYGKLTAGPATIYISVCDPETLEAVDMFEKDVVLELVEEE